MSEKSRPLAGKRIVVTRPRHQAAALSEPLRRHGAHVVEAPAIRIEPPEDRRPLDGALRRLSSFDWIVFTSVNGVDAFFDRLDALGVELPESAAFAAIGPATAEALTGRGRTARVVPDRFVAEEVFRALAENEPVLGRRFLLPRADIAREALPRLLREAGAEVEVVAAYRTVPEAETARSAAESVARGEVDAVTFTSASTARSFFAGVEPGALEGKLVAASIGPITSAALAELGFPPAIEAEAYTIPGLVEAILRHFEKAGAKN